MKRKHDECYTVDVTLDEIIENLNDNFKKQIADHLNLDKLESPKFCLSYDSMKFQFYRIVFGSGYEQED